MKSDTKKTTGRPKGSHVAKSVGFEL